MSLAEELTKQMYQAILQKDTNKQMQLKKEMLQLNLSTHKSNKPITPEDTVFVG